MYSDPTGYSEDDDGDGGDFSDPGDEEIQEEIEVDADIKIAKAPFEKPKEESGKKKGDGKNDKGKEKEKQNFDLPHVPKQDKKDNKPDTQKETGKEITKGNDTGKTVNNDPKDDADDEHGGGGDVSFEKLYEKRNQQIQNSLLFKDIPVINYLETITRSTILEELDPIINEWARLNGVRVLSGTPPAVSKAPKWGTVTRFLCP